MNRQTQLNVNPALTLDSSTPLRRSRLAVVLATAALVGTACGTTSESPSAADQASPAVDEPAVDATTPPESVPQAQRSADNTSNHAARNTAVSVEVEPTSPAAPASETDETGSVDSSTGDTAPVASSADCGSFGPIPPVPDSMPTEQYDTDGDGTADDEVTAYGDGTWVLRIVENDVISQAAMPDITGWAFISNDYKVHGRDFIEVTDNDLGTIYTFATVDGCAELLDTRLPIVDLAPTPTPTPTPDPAPEHPSDLTAPVGICGEFGDGPPLAGIVSEIFVDLAGDGTPDDQVMTYRDAVDSWKIRATVGGVISEVDIDGVGPGWAQVLGTADVGEITSGDEIIANVGASASSTSIGVFGLDDSHCLFRFVDNSGTPLTMYAGATIGHGSQFFCGIGYVGQDAWSLESDGTYFMSGYALIESNPGVFSYMPASDGFAEGLSEADLPTDLFDCNGLTL